jgi:methylmalonyl-CoA mutase cobalamin-binding domain/chain
MKNASNILEPGSGRGRDLADAAGQEFRLELIQRKVHGFATRMGRRPRVLVGHIGPSGRRHALNQIATLFARWGFDVDIGPLNQTPHQIALTAMENDVHLICLLGDPDRQPSLAGEVIDALRHLNSDDIRLAIFRAAAPERRNGMDSEPRELLEIHLESADSDILAIMNSLSQPD